MSEKLQLHFTDLRNYTSCPRKFYFATIERLVRKVEHPALSFGRYGHTLLHKHYASMCANSNFVEPTEAIDVEEDAKDFCNQLVDLYKQEYAKKDQELIIESVEDVREVEFNGINILFTIDVLYKHYGKYFIMDHKFYERTPNLGIIELDEQLKGYMLLARKLGINVHGAVLNIIIKKSLEAPPLLKNGKLSTAQRTLDHTTYDLYLKAITENNLDPQEYVLELNTLQLRGSGIFMRLPAMVKTNAELANYEDELRVITTDIQDKLELVSDCEPSQAHSIFYASPSNMCAGCPFLDLCKARSTMPYENYLEVRNMDYRIKEETER